MGKKRRTLRRVFTAAAGLIALVGGWLVYASIWGKPPAIDLFYERVFVRFALDDPELLTSLRLLEPYGLDFHNNDLTDASPQFEDARLSRTEDELGVLNSFDRSKQTTSQILSTDVLSWFLDDIARGRPFLYYDYPVNQLDGVQSRLPSFLATMHQIKNARDAKNYTERLSKFPDKFSQVLDGLRVREAKGIIPPRFVIERVLLEMSNFISKPANENILYTSAKEKLEKAAVPERDKILADISTKIESDVYPAYKTLIAYFEELKPKSTTDDGAWKHPNGDAYYAHMLRSNTTTNMTPAEVHDLGLKEVARIQDEMKLILASAGIEGKSVGEAMTALGKEPRFLYPNTDDGKKECLRDYQRLIDEIDKGLTDAFDIRPNIGVKVEPVPAFKEKTAPGAYYESPALDGSRPGVFFANLRSMEEISKFGMRTLTYHEAIPGHHFQIALQQSIQGVPTFRKIIPFTAYSEGWALYAERLAWELGFENDPYDNLGRLQAELFRAVRLVVDTGIHFKHWTREQAIQYMSENTGMAQSDVTAEIERYIVSPGQACAYKLGMMKILELREKAKSELGTGFDLKKYHNVVLMNGALPLEILEREVDRYIQNEKTDTNGKAATSLQ
jgi:uncharacterized protein (DUF885 family)